MFTFRGLCKSYSVLHQKRTRECCPCPFWLCLFFREQRDEAEGPAVDQTAVGQAQLRQAGQRDERHRHIRRIDHAAHLLPRGVELRDKLCHLAHGEVVHEARNGQRHHGKHLAVRDRAHAAAAFDERIGGQRHVCVIRARDKQIVRVMGDGLRHCALFEAEALEEADALRAGLVVALKDNHLHNVLRGVRLDEAVLHRQLEQPLVVADAVRDDLDHAGLDRSAGPGGRGDPEAFHRDRVADVHRVEDMLREIGGLDLHAHFSVFRDDVAVDHRPRDADVMQIVKEYDIRALARRDAAHLVIHAEAGRDVDRHVLDRLDGVQPLLDGAADDMIQMTVVDERVRVGIVGDQTGKAVVDPVVQHGLDDDRHIVPGTAVAHERIHAVPHLFQYILRARGFMAAADAGGDISVQRRAGIGDGEVTGDDVVGFQCLGKLCVDVFLGSDDVREAHHLAETHNAVPAHHLADIIGMDGRAGILKAGHRRHAGRRVRHGLERGALRVLDHDPDALLAADIADLMRVHENAGRAAGNDRLCVFAHGDHGRFDVDMPVHKAGRDILAACVDDLRLWSDAVRRVAHERDAALGDRNVDALLDLCRADVDQPGVPDDRLRLLCAHGHARERARHLIQRLFAKLVQHPVSSLHVLRTASRS